MAGFLGDIGALGKVFDAGVRSYDSVQDAERKHAETQQAQMQTKALGYDIASNVGYANSLAALGAALGSPPPGPTPVPPGVQSQPAPQPPTAPPPGVPTTSSGQPIVPPGGAIPSSAPPAPQGGPPPQQQGQGMPPGGVPQPPQGQAGPPPQAQPAPPRPSMTPQGQVPSRPPGAPRPQGQPPVGLSRAPQQGQQQGPPPSPQEIAQKSQQVASQAEQRTAQVTQPAQGAMSTQQLAALVMKANPGIEKNPQVFVRTMEKMQKFLSADGKNELAAQKVSLEYDAKIQKIQQDGENAARKADNAVQVATIKAETATQIAQIAQERALLLQAQKDAAAGGRQDKDIDAKGNRQDKDLADKDKRLDETLKSRGDIEKFKAATKEKLAAGKDLTDDEVSKIAEVRSRGDTSVMQLGMSQGQRGRVLALATDLAKERGTTLNAEDAAYGGTKAAANVVGRTEGGVALGTAELKKLIPQVLDAAKKVNVGQFPTLTAFSEYAQRHKGEPEITTLDNFVQNVKNAYQQVAARGGRLSDAQRKEQQSLIDGTMSMPQLIAAGQSMLREAAIVKDSAGQAMKDVTGGGDAAPASGALPPGWSVREK